MVFIAKRDDDSMQLETCRQSHYIYRGAKQITSESTDAGVLS